MCQGAKWQEGQLGAEQAAEGGEVGGGVSQPIGVDALSDLRPVDGLHAATLGLPYEAFERLLILVGRSTRGFGQPGWRKEGGQCIAVCQEPRFQHALDEEVLDWSPELTLKLRLNGGG